MPRESENFAGILSTVQLNPVPVSDAKKNTGIIWPKFLTEISVQIVSAPGGGGVLGLIFAGYVPLATGLSEPLPNLWYPGYPIQITLLKTRPHGEMPFATIATLKLSGLICPITRSLYPEVQLLALLYVPCLAEKVPLLYTL